LWTSTTFIVFVMILSVVSVGRVNSQQQSAVIPNQPAQNGGSEFLVVKLSKEMLHSQPISIATATD
jgi:hypothetical protein